MTRRLAEEIRTARLSAGLSQQALAHAAGLSASQVRRIEQDRVPGVSVRTLALLFAVLGMRLSARPYPDGPPLRDAAHARLLSRFQARLPSPVRMRTEVPLWIDGDRRAWDAELATLDDTCKLEAETVLHDLQATDRKVALKMADSGTDRVILLVADTRRNRHVLAEFRPLLRSRYPLETRALMQHLRAGRLPPLSGVAVL